MFKHTFTTILIAFALILTGCGGLSFRAEPVPESMSMRMLVSSTSTSLQPDHKGLYPFHHAWNSGYCAAEPNLSVYIPPVDISRIDPMTLRSSNLDDEDLAKLAEYTRTKVARAFSERKETFRVVEIPPVEGRVVELSLVELTGTAVFRNVLGTALGAVVPGAGLISMRSSGTIGIEGVVREARTKEPVFVFADRERGKVAPFSFNDFGILSHARVAIDDWSKQIVASCAATPGTRVPDSAVLTLVPL